MDLLTVAATLHRLHHQVFCRNERQIFSDGFLNDLLIDPKPIGHILRKAKNCITAKEAFRERNAAVCRIVQRSFQPLRRCGHRCVHGIRHQVACKGADPLAAHGITLVGHGRRTDLILLKGFFYLTVVLQKPDVVCHAVAALCHRGKRVQDTTIHFAGIGLTCHVKAFVKAEICCDHAVHLVDFRCIAFKQIHKAGFGSGRSAAAEEPDIADGKINLLQVR